MADRETDESVFETIKQLVDEEHALWDRTDLDDHAVTRLRTIRVELDRYWDLLRQRRALEEFGEDPGRAHIRPASVVERYKQ
jgi:Protein of unknown function (DUF2630)